jgi:pyruvate kinase
MALEMSFREIPIAQKHIIAICREQGVPVITATQMLESMIKASKPTRAEVTDVANAVFDGTDALMLSGETAIGHDPVETVRVMSRIAYRAEQAWRNEEVPPLPLIPVAKAVGATISYTAHYAAKQVGAACIVSYTRSGGTARRISRFRPEAPILVLTPSAKTYHQTALSWGVTPLLVDNMLNTDSMTEQAINCACEMGLAKPGDNIIITAGNPNGPTGNTNLIRIESVPLA